MIKGKDIVVVGIQAWDIEIGSNCKNIAAELARYNRVLYVNPPLNRISMYREKHKPNIKKRINIVQGKEQALVQLQDNLWNLYPESVVEPLNQIPLAPLYDFFNKINAKRFAADIKRATETLGFSRIILFNDSSMFLGQHLNNYLQATFSVYYMRDNLKENPYWRKHGLRIEPITLANADLVVNNSDLYAEYGKEHNPHSYMVGQGCDTDLFDEEKQEIALAADMADIPQPRIGYVGFLSARRLDLGIIQHMAEQRPNWSLVLVGPEDDTFQASALHHIKNVYFLGAKEPETLPTYIKGFDIAINPQLLNKATVGNYPRKIDEYLVMGKATLATATRAMDYFADYTYLCTNKEDYVSLAEKALAEDNLERQKARMQFGKSHSWENCVNNISNYIYSVAAEKEIEL